MKHSSINETEALALMERAAIEAGGALIKMQSKSVRIKSKKDFLTDADLKSEKIILTTLESEYPEIPLLSEERGGKEIKDGYLWIIDPIDGTINFFIQDDNWGISIALVKNGITVAGVVYLPARKELFSALKNRPSKFRNVGGKNNWLRLNVNKDDRLTDTQFWLEWGKEENSGDDHKKVYEIIKRLDRHTLYPQIRNSATADMMMVARGKIAGFVFSKPEPFDIAAAGLIVEQAGGTVTDIEGTKWNPFSKSLVASNGILHDDLLRVIRK